MPLDGSAFVTTAEITGNSGGLFSELVGALSGATGAAFGILGAGGLSSTPAAVRFLPLDISANMRSMSAHAP